MKHSPIWAFVIIISVFALFFATQYFSLDRPSDDTVVFEVSEDVVEEVIKNEDVEQEELEVLIETDVIENPELIIQDGDSRFETDSFFIDYPESWLLKESGWTFLQEGGETTLLYDLQNKESEGIADEDLLIIRFQTIKKDGRAFHKVVDAWSWGDEFVKKTVLFMQNNTEPPYNDISSDDIVVENGEFKASNPVALFSSFSCLKTCYIEGGPPTQKRYFFDYNSEEILMIQAQMITSEMTQVFLNEADRIVSDIQFKIL